MSSSASDSLSAAGARPGEPAEASAYARPADSERLAALLQAAALDDRHALRQLYEHTASKLFGLALRITGRSDWAEDAVQESFVSIWHHAGDYRPHLAAPATWMTAIVRNRALDCLRRHAAERSGRTVELDESYDDWLADERPGPDDRLLASQHAVALERCLRELDQRQRQAIALAYMNDLSHSELAERLQVPLGTVKSWIRRGLERLRTCLGTLI